MLRLIAQYSKRCIGTHRADCLVTFNGHGGEQQLQFFIGVTKDLLALEHGQVIRFWR